MNPFESLARSRKASAIAKAIAEGLPSGQALPAELPVHTWTLATEAAGVPFPSDETKARVLEILAAWASVEAARTGFANAVAEYENDSGCYAEVGRTQTALDRAIWSLVETALNGKERNPSNGTGQK